MVPEKQYLTGKQHLISEAAFCNGKHAVSGNVGMIKKGKE